jgi:short-subunit dehydrogenase
MTQGSILITGATSGIGRALALVYAEPGTALALTGRDTERLKQVRAECESRGANVMAEILDVQDSQPLADWIERVDAWSPISLAIANAGITTGTGIGRPRESRDAATRIIRTNVLGVMNTVIPVVDRMTPRGRGQIAMVGSLAGYRGLPYLPAYSASKAAVSVYAEALRAQLVGTGIAVSLIAPGSVATPKKAQFRLSQPLEISPERAARIIRRGLARRARVIAFPRVLYYSSRLLPYLPGRLVDRILARVKADLPE